MFPLFSKKLLVLWLSYSYSMFWIWWFVNVKAMWIVSFSQSDDNKEWVSSTCNYGEKFIASIRRGNVHAVQFHPEKSGGKFYLPYQSSSFFGFFFFDIMYKTLNHGGHHLHWNFCSSLACNWTLVRVRNKFMGSTLHCFEIWSNTLTSDFV